jgi:hypothetical protein
MNFLQTVLDNKISRFSRFPGKKTTKPSLFAKLESQVQAHRPIPDGPHPELPGGWSPKASRSAPATRWRSPGTWSSPGRSKRCDGSNEKMEEPKQRSDDLAMVELWWFVSSSEVRNTERNYRREDVGTCAFIYFGHQTCAKAVDFHGNIIEKRTIFIDFHWTNRGLDIEHLENIWIGAKWFGTRHIFKSLILWNGFCTPNPWESMVFIGFW